MRSPEAVATRPLSGVRTPVSRRSSVLLPAPLRPTTPMRSRSSTPTDTAASRVVVPCDFDTPSRVTSKAYVRFGRNAQWAVISR